MAACNKINYIYLDIYECTDKMFARITGVEERVKDWELKIDIINLTEWIIWWNKGYKIERL